MIVGQARVTGEPDVLTPHGPAVEGAFDLLADRYGACHLREIRRFTEPWERDASRRLRRRDPAALADYAMRGRIHGGKLTDIEAKLFDAWRADALSTDDHGQRRSVLMIVATNEQTALIYATTAHRAQGMTVAVCHAAISADASHEQLYVAATRGRKRNHLCVIVDSRRDVVRDPDDLPTAEQVLSRVLQRRDPDRLSATKSSRTSRRRCCP